MADTSMKRQYVMLKPMVAGATGFARIEAQTDRLLLQLTCKELRHQAKGLRVFLYLGEGAAHEIGHTLVNPQGQATLNTDLDWRKFSLSPQRLQAILILSDDSVPRPLLIGLCTQQSAGSLMDAKNAALALCQKLTVGIKPVICQEPASPRSTQPAPTAPKESSKAALKAPPGPSRPESAKPVDRLRPLIWPPQFRELPAYFDQYPPVALFELPGWRFVRVPMTQGGYFAVGYCAQGERVTRVSYAVPGTANQPPPRQFDRYRFYYGRDGQGYWTLGQRVKKE